MAINDILKEDLLKLEPKEFYLKHIVKSHNWYFSEYLHIPSKEIVDKMDFFKEIVSTRLKINFHSMQIVGSAKTGYSLSPNKVLQPFRDAPEGRDLSDIDIAIISEMLYSKFWMLLRKVDSLYYKYNKVFYERLAKSIFRGYINDKALQKFIREEWEALIVPTNMALQDSLHFEHPITYRIYRSWEDLEEYQLIGISKAKAVLEGKKNV